MTTVAQRLGHPLAGAAEQAKIDVAETGSAQIDLSVVESGLAATLHQAGAAAAIEADLQRIVDAAAAAVRLAGAAPAAVDVLEFTGGSTRLALLVQRIAACVTRGAASRNRLPLTLVRAMGRRNSPGASQVEPEGSVSVGGVGLRAVAKPDAARFVGPVAAASRRPSA